VSEPTNKSSPPLDYAAPTREVRGAAGSSEALAVVGLLYAALCAMIATPSTGYGADSAKQGPIAIGVLAGVVYPAWRSCKRLPTIAPRDFVRIATATIGMSLILVTFGLQMRAFKLDGGFPQPRYRLGLIPWQSVAATLLGFCCLALSEWQRHAQRALQAPPRRTACETHFRTMIRSW